MARTSQRDGIKQISPPWLADDSPATASNPTGGVGGRFMYSLGIASDMLLEKMNQAARAHMPTHAPVTALPYLGADRVLVQGPGESSTAFALRLKEAFDFWQYAGSSRAVLGATAAFLTGFQGTSATTVPICANVGGFYAEKWSWLNNTDDPRYPSQYNAPAQNWSWDGNEAAQWWREWLICYFNASAPVYSFGTGISIGAFSGNFATLTGLSNLPSGLTSVTLPAYITISGAASAGNNGTFQVTAWISASSITVAMPGGVASDANNGSIAATISYFPALQPMPVWGFPGAVWGGNTSQAIGVQMPGTVNQYNVPGLVTGLQSVLATVKSAQSWYVSIVLRFAMSGTDLAAGTEFSPWSTESTGNPNGTWSTWGKNVGGVWKPAWITGVQFGAFDAFCGGTMTYGGAPVAFGV